MRKIKILLFANHNNGVNILNYLVTRKDADLKLVVVQEESKKVWWQSAKQAAIKNNLEYLVFQDDLSLFNKIKNIDFDLIISASWRKKFPKKILALAKIGAVNFHNSLLPKYRSAYANSWPIYFGEDKTGVTLHWMTENFDDGDIIAQQALPIYPWDTAKEVWERINEQFLNLFQKMWPRVNEWKKNSKPQKGQSSFFTIKDYLETNQIPLDKKVKIQDFVNFLRSRTFLPYYRNAYFIDPISKSKVYISLLLERER